MAMRFSPKHFTFDSPGTQSGFAEFGNTVRTAGGSLQGFGATYGSSDHHLKNIKVQVTNVTPQGTGVSFDVTFDLRDDGDRKGSSEVDVLIIADVESA